MHIQHHAGNRGARYAKYFFFFTGAASLLWMCIRIIPKPSRAEYPCMKAAAPIAGGFIAYIAGAAAAVFSLKKARRYFQSSKYLLASVLFVAGLAAGSLAIFATDTETYAVEPEGDSLFVPTDPPNTPMGTARGIYPGRVVWMWDSSATSWDGRTGYWWDDRWTRQDKVDSMLSNSLRELTGKSTDEEAWDALFKYFNERHGKGTVGYLAGEKIIIKINLNQSSVVSSNTGNSSLTSPHMVLALLRQLATRAGIPDSNITFYDMIRYMPDQIFNKCRSEFPHVHFMGWQQANGREKYVRDLNSRIRFSQDLTLEINGGNPTYVATAVSQAAYMINLASFKAHTYMGVTFCAKNHFGSLSADYKGTPDQWAPHGAGVHAYSTVHYISNGGPEYTFYERPMGSYNALVDLMGFKDLGGKTMLFMIDALYAAEDEHHSVSSTSKFLQSPFNNDWTSSLFISQDEIALESVGLDFFRTEEAINPQIDKVYGSVDNYLHEGALADNPPSGTFYDPERDGTRLQSLGVHEHWNNATDKMYSRDLGTGQGIELVKMNPLVTSIAVRNVPSGFVLYSNYPNPFNPTTTIAYQTSVRSRVTLDILDVRGRVIATLVDGEQPPGLHHIEFGAKNLSSGIYFYRMQGRPLAHGIGAAFNETRKLVFLK